MPIAPRGHSWLTQSQPFILSARLLYLRKWTEGDEEEKEKERGRMKDHAKLVKARAEAQGRSNLLHWTPFSVSQLPPWQQANRWGGLQWPGDYLRGWLTGAITSPSKYCLHFNMHSKTELNLGSTQWNCNTFYDLFPIFVALLFLSADHFLYQQLQLFVFYKNIIFNLS